MPLTPEEVQAWRAHFKELYNEIGREPWVPPSSEKSSNRRRAQTGLLTPNPEDHGAAHSAGRQPNPDRFGFPSPRPDESVAQLHQWFRSLPKPAPACFLRLDLPQRYISRNPDLNSDWHQRSSRSKTRKRPYLFALDYSIVASGEPAVAVVGDDTASEPFDMPTYSEPAVAVHWDDSLPPEPTAMPTPGKRHPSPWFGCVADDQ